EVPPLVDRIGPQRREDVLRDELAADIHDLHGVRAAAPRFRPHLVEVVSLTDIGDDRHDLRAVALLQPGDNDRGVEPSAVGQRHSLGTGHRPPPAAASPASAPTALRAASRVTIASSMSSRCTISGGTKRTAFGCTLLTSNPRSRQAATTRSEGPLSPI